MPHKPYFRRTVSALFRITVEIYVNKEWNICKSISINHRNVLLIYDQKILKGDRNNEIKVCNVSEMRKKPFK